MVIESVPDLLSENELTQCEYGWNLKTISISNQIDLDTEVRMSHMFQGRVPSLFYLHHEYPRIP